MEWRPFLPIEAKATTRGRLGDAVYLRAFRAEYGKKSCARLLLHTGSMLEWLAPDILAASWWRVLQQADEKPNKRSLRVPVNAHRVQLPRHRDDAKWAAYDNSGESPGLLHHQP